MRPPSKGVTGTRLKRFSTRPEYATASSNRLSDASPANSTASAAAVPTNGPAKAIRASCATDSGASLSSIQAPTKGMKVGAPTSSPSRRADT